MPKVTPQKAMRDRVKELRRVRAGDLATNPANWRKHPKAQVDALKGVLAEIGFAGALLAYETPQGLTLIDGHLRAGLSPDAEVPVLVLDVNEEEARKLLVTYDPLSAMAQPNQDALLALLRDVSFENPAVNAMLEALANGEASPMPFPSLPDGDKSPIGQMTFTVTDIQRAAIQDALDRAKGMGDFGGTGNENSNGNALVRICETFMTVTP